MNTQQIELIITVAETRSISKAAEKLFLSQSNASGMIKALEQEVGFSIFHRSNAGAVPTEKGEKLISRAQIIRQQVSEIHKLKHAETILHFRLGATNYTPVIWAFYQLYKEYEGREYVDFSCQNFEWRAAIRGLHNLKLDIFVGMFMELNLEEFDKEAKKNQMTQIYIKEIPIKINLRKGHPLAGKKELDLDELAQYPCVDYCREDLVQMTNQAKDGKLVRYKYRLRVEESEMRRRMVSLTDAFSVGCKLPKSMMEEYGFVSYPFTSQGFKMYAIVREGEEKREEIRRYLEILQDKLVDI